MACKGLCFRWKAENTGGKYLRYINGNVRCQVCEIFITPEGVVIKDNFGGKYCRCCGNRIRSKPRCSSCKKAYQTLPPMKVNGLSKKNSSR